MTARTLERNPETSSLGIPGAAEPVRDISGYAVFARGEAGAAHAMAHRTLDAGHIELGHRRLGEWLNGRSGSGSEWVHLHFHMAIFELAVGDWDSAYARFLEEVLPTAAATEDALTDAPALLWRLAISAPRPLELPWQCLHRTALARMRRPSTPFVELHNLLALAGAGDTVSIERWLQTRPAVAPSRAERLVERMAVALRALAARSYHQAAAALQSVAPETARIGGSQAQNQLFEALADWSRLQAGAPSPHPIQALAA